MRRQEYTERGPSATKKRRDRSDDEESDPDLTGNEESEEGGDAKDSPIPQTHGASRQRQQGPLNRLTAQLGVEVQYRCELCKKAMRGRVSTWWAHRLGESSCTRAKKKPRLGGKAPTKVEAPARRESTLMDKLVLQQSPPVDRDTAAQYEGAPFIRQAQLVAPSRPARSAQPLRKRHKQVSAKVAIQRSVQAAKERREAREAAAAAASALDPEVACTGARSWEERDAELRQAAVDLDAED